MGRYSCVSAPEAPNGEESRMYKDLVKKLQNRPQANLIYADYQASNMADAMDQDSRGFKRNRQGEHTALNIMKFIDYAAWQSEMTNIGLLEKQIGAKDSNGRPIDYKRAEEAMKIAEDFNNPPGVATPNRGVVADVVKYGTTDPVYNVVLSQKDSRTFMQPLGITEKLKIWEMHKQAFNAVGIDIENLPQEVEFVFSAFNSEIAQSLMNIQNIQIDNLYKENALVLFHSNANSPQVRALVNSFGSIDAAAQALHDFNHGTVTLTRTQMREMLNAINYCKKFNNIDLVALKQQEDQMRQQVTTGSPQEDIKNELHKLNKKYHIDIDEVHRNNEEATRLSEAAADAVVTLNRKARELDRKGKNNPESRRMRALRNKVMDDLAAKKYYSGILKYMQEVQDDMLKVELLSATTPSSTTRIERAFELATAYQDAKDIIEQYYLTVSALADENTLMDESLSQTDIDNLRRLATDTLKYMDKKLKAIKDQTEGVMTDILIDIVGDTAPNGMAIANAVKMAEQDSTIFDWLYSVGRVSNPIIGAMGRVIRNAQNERDAIMRPLALRIRRATNKLYEAGYSSEFMYEDDGHIISDIDWAAYNDAKEKETENLRRQGLKGFDFQEALAQWEEANQMDIVVDSTNGRTEKVPNMNYRKPFPNLAPAQQVYYNEMMQIKGEIGSMLPEYAQNHFLPPQVRRKMADALAHAKGAKDYAKAIYNKAKDYAVVREDDEMFASNGIINGEEYTAAAGDHDNTALKEIPIFFVNPVEQDELLKDFSGALQMLAGTAINYKAMNEISQVVHFMGDFVKSKAARDPKNRSEVVNNQFYKVVKDLFASSKKNTNTAALVDGFINQHLYLKRVIEKEPKWLTKWMGNIIGYTSFRGLSTNLPGAVANAIMGEFQMLIEAGAGEFYGWKDFFWAHTRLFGGSGVGGEIAELLTNNVNHKGVLLREYFDPLNENFSEMGHTRYYRSTFRQLFSHDCSFIGYSSGEYIIHYVNMYSVLHNKKVRLNGKEICLYDAFEVSKPIDGNSELLLKQGVTLKDGTPLINGDAATEKYLNDVRNEIRYVNQSTHGSMNFEDKGLLHRIFIGRAIMNFRQWMVEHYSRRWRGRHFDATLKQTREGFYRTLFMAPANEDVKDAWQNDHKMEAIGMYVKDFITFLVRSEANWNNLDDMQKMNIKRARAEIMLHLALLAISWGLGEADDHKREKIRRAAILMTKRSLREIEASMPNLRIIQSATSIFRRPAACIDTFNSVLYLFYGLTQGDIFEEVKSGKHKGENVYFRNVQKNVLPFFKDWEHFTDFGESDAMFKMFKDSPSNY